MLFENSESGSKAEFKICSTAKAEKVMLIQKPDQESGQSVDFNML